jgi:hypothetical protein
VKCLQDFHSLRPNEIGWAGAIVLYEKQQVVIRQKDGPVGSPPSSGWGHLCPCRAMRAATPPYWESTTLLGVGHLCHVESRGPARRGPSAKMGAALTLVAFGARRDQQPRATLGVSRLSIGVPPSIAPVSCWSLTYAVAGREPSPLGISVADAHEGRCSGRYPCCRPPSRVQH